MRATPLGVATNSMCTRLVAIQQYICCWLSRLIMGNPAVNTLRILPCIPYLYCRAYPIILPCIPYIYCRVYPTHTAMHILRILACLPYVYQILPHMTCPTRFTSPLFIHPSSILSLHIKRIVITLNPKP
jgi:hypothetical protein